MIGDDIKTQTEVTLENFKRVVMAAGSNVDNVLQTTVYLKDLKDYAGMNKVYSGFFRDPKPARPTFQAELPLRNASRNTGDSACSL